MEHSSNPACYRIFGSKRNFACWKSKIKTLPTSDYVPQFSERTTAVLVSFIKPCDQPTTPHTLKWLENCETSKFMRVFPLNFFFCCLFHHGGTKSLVRQDDWETTLNIQHKLYTFGTQKIEYEIKMNFIMLDLLSAKTLNAIHVMRKTQSAVSFQVCNPSFCTKCKFHFWTSHSCYHFSFIFPLIPASTQIFMMHTHIVCTLADEARQ